MTRRFYLSIPRCEGLIEARPLLTVRPTSPPTLYDRDKVGAFKLLRLPLVALLACLDLQHDRSRPLPNTHESVSGRPRQSIIGSEPEAPTAAIHPTKIPQTASEVHRVSRLLGLQIQEQAQVTRLIEATGTNTKTPGRQVRTNS